MNTHLPVGYIASNGVSLAPEDTLGRAVELLQGARSGAVPVMENGFLRGLVSDREVARGLSRNGETRVSDVMTQDVPIAPAAMRAGEALDLLSTIDFPALPVVMPDGRFLGTVGRAELLSALYRRRRPHMVGGMATPFGVYLSDGAHRGGAGDLALASTGFFLFIGSFLASVLGMLGSRAWHEAGLGGYLPAPYVALPIFLAGFALWFRLSPVAGYHAAEHQAVHAIERNEPLTVERLRQMPRPHPRCGTNLVVAFALFATLVQILHLDAFFAGVFTLLSFRFFGHWVQQYVTTRPATLKQLISGVHSAEQLLERYQEGASPSRYMAWRRVWNTGLPQVALGNMLPWYGLQLLASQVPFVRELARFLQ